MHLINSIPIATQPNYNSNLILVYWNGSNIKLRFHILGTMELKSINTRIYNIEENDDRYTELVVNFRNDLISSLPDQIMTEIKIMIVNFLSSDESMLEKQFCLTYSREGIVHNFNGTGSEFLNDLSN